MFWGLLPGIDRLLIEPFLYLFFLQTETRYSIL